MTFSMAHRTVAPECWINCLARSARRGVPRDLRLLNFWNGKCPDRSNCFGRIYAAQSRRCAWPSWGGRREFFLRLAARWAGFVWHEGFSRWTGIHSVSNQTRAAFSGWGGRRIIAAMYLTGCRRKRRSMPGGKPILHHFERDRLAALLRFVSQSSRLNRGMRTMSLRGGSGGGLACSACSLQCHHRHDAPISVRAGFRAGELSAACRTLMDLREERSGLFSHLLWRGRKPDETSPSRAVDWPDCVGYRPPPTRDSCDYL